MTGVCQPETAPSRCPWCRALVAESAQPGTVGAGRWRATRLLLEQFTEGDQLERARRASTGAGGMSLSVMRVARR